MKKQVLIIDDEPRILKFLSISLKAAGFDVVVTSDGEDGLKLVKEVSPDIMLLDVLMSPLSGFDILARLRAFSNLPVLAFSAKDDICEPIIKAGANDCIKKPFLPDQLIKKIAEILDNYQAGN